MRFVNTWLLGFAGHAASGPSLEDRLLCPCDGDYQVSRDQHCVNGMHDKMSHLFCIQSILHLHAYLAPEVFTLTCHWQIRICVIHCNAHDRLSHAYHIVS